MSEWVLLFVRDLNFAIWLGGLIVLDCIEAPARFRTPELDRNQIVAVGRQVFAAFNRVELLLGATLLAVSFWQLRAGFTVLFTTLMGMLGVGCVSLMLALALAQFFVLRPRLAELSEMLDLVNREAGDLGYAEMRKKHQLYIALDVLKIALGLIALGCRSFLQGF